MTAREKVSDERLTYMLEYPLSGLTGVDIKSMAAELLRLRTSQEWQGIASAPAGVSVLVCGGTYSTGDHENLPSTGVSIAHLMGMYGWLDASEYDGQEVWRKPAYWKPIPPPKGEAP